MGHLVDQGETMFSEKTTCRNLFFASHVLKTRRSRWWFRWFKHEFACGISLSAVFKVFSAGRLSLPLEISFIILPQAILCFRVTPRQATAS